MFSRADAYERFMGRWSRLLAPELVAFAGVRDGDVVLDVGCGSGALSIAVGDATKTARVTGIDPSPEYVRYAASSGEDPRVRFEIGDAQKLAFPDATFDKVLSALVLNFVPVPSRAASEMIRVTKRGGVVATAVWDYADGMEMLRIFWDEAIKFDPAIEKQDEGHMPLCKQGELAAFWNARGLTDVQQAALVVPLRFASFDDYWEPFSLGQGPAGAYASNLPLERREELRERLRVRLLPGGENAPIEMKARAWAVKGVVAAN